MRLSLIRGRSPIRFYSSTFARVLKERTTVCWATAAMTALWKVEVAGFEEGGRSYHKKLLSMGLTTGTRSSVTRVAPMGDPVEIQVRGFRLSLSRDEAAAVQVEMQ